MSQMPIDLLYFICQLSHTFIRFNCCFNICCPFLYFFLLFTFFELLFLYGFLNVFTAVTILSSEVFCLSNATRSSFCRISSVFLTQKLNVLIFPFNSVCCFSIIAQLSRRGRQFVENAQAIRFLLKSPFNFLQIITNSAGIQARKTPFLQLNRALVKKQRNPISLNSTLTKYKAHC